MKKNIIIITLFMIFSYLNVYSQNNVNCPEGWHHHSFQATYNGCVYNLEFCYLCDGYGTYPGNSIRYFLPTPVNPVNCPTPPRNWVLNQVIDQYINLCTIPPCSSGQVLEMTVDVPICQKLIHYEYNGEYHEHMESCLNSNYLCVLTFNLCFDTSTGSWYIDEDSKYQFISGTSDCLEHKPDLSGYPIDEYWESPCWENYDCPQDMD